MSENRVTVSASEPRPQPAVWSHQLDDLADALDTVTQLLSVKESAARQEAARLSNNAAGYPFPSVLRESFATQAANERGKADGYMVAHRAILEAFRPLTAQVFVAAVADALDEDRCEATDV